MFMLHVSMLLHGRYDVGHLLNDSFKLERGLGGHTPLKLSLNCPRPASPLSNIVQTMQPHRNISNTYHGPCNLKQIAYSVYDLPWQPVGHANAWNVRQHMGGLCDFKLTSETASPADVCLQILRTMRTWLLFLVCCMVCILSGKV